MKNITFVTVALLFILNSIQAQVLWSENFDNLTTGSVGTDLTGQTPGKGGWYTLGLGNNLISNFDFRIEAENGRGNVLIIRSILNTSVDPIYAERRIWKGDINNDWKLRDSLSNNNILKFEYYFFIEKKSTIKDKIFEELSYTKDNCLLFKKVIDGKTNELSVTGVKDNLKLPNNKWIKAIVYLDYYKGDIYHEYPDLNYLVKSDLNIGFIEEDHAMGSLSFKLKGYDSNEDYYQIKLDDLTISAVNALPKLDTDTYFSKRFNLFPNPATNVVNITNNENMLVEQITVYDISGKQLTTQNYNNQTQIQLNVENLASGTYTLHIHTNAGLAIKKLVKQ